MHTVLAETRYTPDDMFRFEEQGLYELVDGRLVEKGMSSLATNALSHLVFEVELFFREHPLGSLFVEQSFQCFPGERNLVRRPDAAVVVNDRLKGVAEEGHVKIAPDLAIEVVSPNDKVYDLEEKLADYRAAGVRLVWVLNPKWKAIRIYHADHAVAELFEGDTLTGEPVLPGFSVPVSRLMPKPTA